MDCQTCSMNLPDGVVFHPHLYCVLYQAYAPHHPEDMLRRYGFERVGAFKLGADDRAGVIPNGPRAVGRATRQDPEQT